MNILDMGGISRWLERRTRDWKVAGSNSCWSGGRIFFSRVDFLCWLLLRYPFHTRVTAVKDPGHSAESAYGTLQLNTHAPYVCGFAWSDMVHVYMVYTDLAEATAVLRCTSHASAVSTPLKWKQKTNKNRYKKLVTHVEPLSIAVSLLENRKIALYTSDQQQQ